MTLTDIENILQATGYPVAYSHFVSSTNNPPPTPPFITYLVPYSYNFFADNKVYKKNDALQIELYTKKKDLTVEKNLEDLLDTNEIAYDYTEVWIDSEKLFQKIYEVRLI